MDTINAFAMGQAHRNDEHRVFDWDKAAQIIRDHGAKNATAGLRSDMDWTAGCIFADGKPKMDGGAYLSSCWAVPVLVLDESEEEIECWRMASQVPGWDAHTDWPPSSLAILGIAAIAAAEGTA